MALTDFIFQRRLKISSSILIIILYLIIIIPRYLTVTPLSYNKKKDHQEKQISSFCLVKHVFSFLEPVTC